MAAQPPDADPTSLKMMWWSARNPPVNPRASFAGKTVLITGSNVGLGFEAAVKFATLSADRLILAVRSLHRGEEAKAQVCRQTGYDPSRIELYELDMSSFASVTAFTSALKEKEGRRLLHVAVLNAGIAPPTYKLSPDGYEMSLQVCVLSTALLATLLLPQLRDSAEVAEEPSHLELVGSVGHQLVKPEVFDNIDFATSFTQKFIIDMLNQETFFNARTQYNINKLLVMYIMNSLVEVTDPAKVIINTVCPALCRTNLGRDFSGIMKTGVGLFQLVMARSAEQGARSYVSGVLLGSEGHGGFWSHDALYKKGDLVTSEKGKVLQKRVWKEIIEILVKHVPEKEGYAIQYGVVVDEGFTVTKRSKAVEAERSRTEGESFESDYAKQGAIERWLSLSKGSPNSSA